MPESNVKESKCAYTQEKQVWLDVFQYIPCLKCEAVIVVVNDDVIMALKYLYPSNLGICISTKFFISFLFSGCTLWMILFYFGWQRST